MKKTSLWARLVIIPAKSPAFSTIGPEACLIFESSSFETMLASVVLPNPGGPKSKT